ncbi:hypothetical protein EVAR_47989_1 [Eumeta japonica]|uniref:Uncharacterized protein n=1 Tax=Eumeta variegata TaxID=151549 RepID=A0A4C1XI82_EUMVA|nr:hypothetical protein EVAR_47989_1 [Eumeta japonica]
MRHIVKIKIDIQRNPVGKSSSSPGDNGAKAAVQAVLADWSTYLWTCVAPIRTDTAQWKVYDSNNCALQSTALCLEEG